MKKNVRRRLPKKEKERLANRAHDRLIKNGVVIPDVCNVLDPTQVKRGTSITPIP
jgi:hypothetical protein